MTRHPETAADLAASLPATVFTTGTVSAPRKKQDAETGLIASDDPLDVLAAHARKIKLRSVPNEMIQAEFFIGQKTFHRNLSHRETAMLLETCYSGFFSRGEFTSPAGTASVLVNKKGAITLITGNKTDSLDTGSDIAHDRFKQRLIPEGSPVPFLIDLGVMSAQGSVYKTMYPKYRQINRFLEFVADILPRLRECAEEHPEEPLRIVDFGCGKSYLTFALYHYLHTIEKLPVHITGLDLKKDVIEHCNTLSKNYGYDGLSFMVGDIARYKENTRIDMVVSLHACDTATDYALARAVQWGSPVIFAVPCCQHEVSTQITDASGSSGKAEEFEPLLRHGLIKERFSALLTDTLRAELLESAGYRVQLVEFIDMSHTPKNILIRAVQTREAESEPSPAYRKLASAFGVSLTLESELYPPQPVNLKPGKD